MKYYLPRINSMSFMSCRDHNNYTKESYELIESIYEEMKCIKEGNDDENRTIYVRYKRGPFKDYAKMWELDIRSKKNYQKELEYFLNEYYMEYDWIRIDTYKYQEYKTILINNCFVIQVVPKERRQGFEFDLSDFLKDLYDKIKYSIDLIKNHTYYEKLCKEISYIQRTGIIKLDDLFMLDKDWKNEYYQFITEDDIDFFLKNVNKQIEYSMLIKKEASKYYEEDFKKYLAVLKKQYNVINRIEKMTGNDYYDLCKICYKSINLEGSTELTSKELFYKYGDWGDCGLRDIDLDSPEAFEEWVKKAHDHAFEIRMGSSTTRIKLWVSKDEKGYYLILSGMYLCNSNEVIKFYVELIKNNIPVFLSDAEEIRDRLIGKGVVGIVPHNVMPRYCQSRFNIPVYDFMHLPHHPSEHHDYLKYIKWNDIDNTYLREE